MVVNRRDKIINVTLNTVFILVWMVAVGAFVYDVLKAFFP